MPIKAVEAGSKEDVQELRAQTKRPTSEQRQIPMAIAPALINLQRTYGNRFVQRLLSRAKMGEREAEAAPEVEAAIQRAEGGQPLESGVRAQMESALGADFSDVRVHTNAEADTLNRALSARAFTTGKDIFFREGEYDPGSAVGRELLAHELAHVLQQKGSKVQGKLTISEPGDACEQEAERVAQAVMQQERQMASGEQTAPTPERRKVESVNIAQMVRPRLTSGVRLSLNRPGPSVSGPAVRRDAGPATPDAGPAPRPDAGPAPRPDAGPAPRPDAGPAPRPDAGPTPAPAPVTVSIGPVNAPDTPPAIRRIPPRVNTDVRVTLSGTATPPITLSIDGASATNGTATINGAATHTLTSTETVRLSGVTQTAPGNAGHLKLVANQGPTRKADSNAFSVAAYPKEIGFRFNRILLNEPFPGVVGGIWGAAYDVTFVSDSGPGHGNDCDRTKISENIVVASSSGILAGVTPIQSNFIRTTGTQTDHHFLGAPSPADMRSLINSDPSSRAVFHQFFRFSCERSGIAEDRAAGPKVPTSGFKISHRLTVPSTCGSSHHFVHAKKEGFANNAVAAGTVDDTSEKDAQV